MKTSCKYHVAKAGALAFALAGLAMAQNKPDSAAVKEHIEKAKKLAGKEWTKQEDFFCENPVPNRANDPLIEPVKLFDNFYALGSVSTTIYAITTTEGIVLIDAGYPDQVDSVVLPQLKKAGLDESKIKYVFLGHGHVDHYGAAKYLQDKYGTKVAAAGPDWDLMVPPANSGKQARDDAPHRDMVLTDGQTVKIGDFQMQVVTIPGHTEGSVSYIFPVKEGKKTYVAGLYGGTVLVPRIAWNLDEYQKSLLKWADAAKKANVTVQLQNHPHMLDFPSKLDQLQSRKAGAPNPFVVTNEAYGRYFRMIQECTAAQKQRMVENPPANTKK
ncbi:MAG: MBL fold metallo-hydrolase [Bryobacteraceae bacterium]